MDKKLLIQAFTKFFLGLLIIGLLLFVSAGTFAYWNGWLFLGLLFIPMFLVGCVLIIKNPDLLRKRLQAKETESDQKIVLLLSGLMFISGFVWSGLNFRFSWLILPKSVVFTASVLFLIAYGLYAEVLRENTYLSRIVEVQENQTVIDTGLYGIVRHPMYAATILLFLSIPLILGSIVAFAIFCVYPFIIIKRIKNEEMLLEKELQGYIEYKAKVKYRIIPFVW